ncbi:MAG: hypothetical protein RJA70_406 [Pseudomonadota bacterium]|jgi:hypothetical protein
MFGSTDPPGSLWQGGGLTPNCWGVICSRGVAFHLESIGQATDRAFPVFVEVSFLVQAHNLARARSDDARNLSSR